MKKNKSSISNASTYKEIGDFWDTHSLADYWGKTKPADFDVDIRSEVIFYPLDSGLDNAMRRVAKQKGIKPEKLLNIWVREKIQSA